MTYKTIVIDYAPKSKKMAAAIEQKANEMASVGWELVTFSVTNSAKAILVLAHLKLPRSKAPCLKRPLRLSATRNEAGCY